MTKFSEIKDGSTVSTATTYGAVYSCNCGWIDLGHANPNSKKPYVGAVNLWTQIDGETGLRSANDRWHRVRLEIEMSKWGKTDGVYGEFAVRVGLSRDDKERVALSIFLRVSREFERLQSSGLYSIVTDSGFSGEDLVSNLLGFYHAVRGLDYVSLCKPVSKAAAQKVWQEHGAPGSDKNKNETTDPDFYPCRECASAPKSKTRGLLPPAFRTITEVAIGQDYRLWNPSDPDQANLPAAPPAPSPPPVGTPPPAEKPWDVPVVRGVTLSGIAADKYEDWRYWPLIWDVNQAIIGPNPNRLKSGTTLKVPRLSTFTPEQRQSAIGRAPSWKTFPL